MIAEGEVRASGLPLSFCLDPVSHQASHLALVLDMSLRVDLDHVEFLQPFGHGQEL